MRTIIIAAALATLFFTATCVIDPGGPDGSDIDAGVKDGGTDGGFRGNPRSDAGPDAGIPHAPTEVPLELGHAGEIYSIERSGDRMLTTDGGRWILWNLSTRTVITSGTGRCLTVHIGLRCFIAILRGSTVLIRHPEILYVLDARSGATTAAIIVSSSFRSGLAQDGSYVWNADATGLRAWSTGGALLFERPGDASLARVSAASDELFVAPRPEVAPIIERCRISTSACTSFSFAGGFHSWFEDGDHFLTRQDTAVRVYTATGELVSLGLLPSIEMLTGKGDHIWIHDAGNLRVYRITDLGVQAGEFPFSLYIDRILPSGPFLGLALHRNVGGQWRQWFEIVSLGETVTSTGAIPLPFPEASAFGADGLEWTVGSRRGVIFDSATLSEPNPALRIPFSYGEVFSLSGAANGLAAIATAGGLFVISADETPEVVARLPIVSSQVGLTDDGAKLVATANLPDSYYFGGDESLRVFSVPDGALLHEWPYQTTSEGRHSFFGFSMASSGARVMHMIYEYGTGGWVSRPIVTDLTGTAFASFGPALPGNDDDIRRFWPHFSADGTKAYFVTASGVLLYTDGTLTGTLSRAPIGWLDDQAVIAATFRTTNCPSNPICFDAMKLFDSAGSEVGTTGLPQLMGNIEAVGGGLIYAFDLNTVFDVATGNPVWQTAPGITGEAIAGDCVVFSQGPRVYVDCFR